MPAVLPSCDPAEVAGLENEIAKQPNTLGVGVLDIRTGVIRLFTYEETDAFSSTNPNLQVMAGHEAAAAMAGVPPPDARWFVPASLKCHSFGLSACNGFRSWKAIFAPRNRSTRRGLPIRLRP